jgi:hypothetical protein
MPSISYVVDERPFLDDEDSLSIDKPSHAAGDLSGAKLVQNQAIVAAMPHFGKQSMPPGMVGRYAVAYSVA